MEDVLCVPRRAVFPDGGWHGIVTQNIGSVLRVISSSGEYLPRHKVEDDPAQQQIIPYCVVHCPGDRWLLTRRLKQSSEKRLRHLYSLGIGGHINPVDGRQGNPVLGGLRREWFEEVDCPGAAAARLVAVLNDDTTPVSAVHLGLVFVIDADLVPTIRETTKLEGEALTLEEMRRHYLNMESWSQLTYDALVAGIAERPDSPLTCELVPEAVVPG